MPNVATVLKDEIRRLARKEARTATVRLVASISQLRKSNIAFRRELLDLRRQIKRWKRPNHITSGGPGPEQASTRFSAKGVSRLRRRLSLSAVDLGKLLGVTAQSVYAWEKGQRPRVRQLEVLAKARKLTARQAHELLENASQPAQKGERKHDKGKGEHSNGRRGSARTGRPRRKK